MHQYVFDQMPMFALVVYPGHFLAVFLPIYGHHGGKLLLYYDNNIVMILKVMETMLAHSLSVGDFFCITISRLLH